MLMQTIVKAPMTKLFIRGQIIKFLHFRLDTVSGRMYEPMGQIFLPWIC